MNALIGWLMVKEPGTLNPASYAHRSCIITVFTVITTLAPASGLQCFAPVKHCDLSAISCAFLNQGPLFVGEDVSDFNPDNMELSHAQCPLLFGQERLHAFPSPPPPHFDLISGTLSAWLLVVVMGLLCFDVLRCSVDSLID